jgi:hypothetical protein
MFPQIIGRMRFDDVGPRDAQGFYEYCYQGYTYEIATDESRYQVRTYDDEPGRAMVITPKDAIDLPQTRALVDFLAVELNCTAVLLYCHSIGAYRSIDLHTLQFEE